MFFKEKAETTSNDYKLNLATWIKYFSQTTNKDIDSLLVRGIALSEDSVIEELLLVLLLSRQKN